MKGSKAMTLWETCCNMHKAVYTVWLMMYESSNKGEVSSWEMACSAFPRVSAIWEARKGWKAVPDPRLVFILRIPLRPTVHVKFTTGAGGRHLIALLRWTVHTTTAVFTATKYRAAFYLLSNEVPTPWSFQNLPQASAMMWRFFMWWQLLKWHDYLTLGILYREAVMHYYVPQLKVTNSLRKPLVLIFLSVFKGTYFTTELRNTEPGL